MVMRTEEEEGMLLKREKKCKKKNKEIDLWSPGELELIPENTSAETIDNDRKKKKRQKSEKKVQSRYWNLKEQVGDVELAFPKKEKMKKEKKSKVEREEGSYDGREMSKDEKEPEYEVELEVKKDKKKRKKDKYIASKEGEFESCEEEDMSIVAEVGEGCTINEQNKGTIKKKDKVAGDVESLSINDGSSGQGEMRNDNLHLRIDEKASDEAILLEVEDKKKQQKEKKYKSKEGNVQEDDSIAVDVSEGCNMSRGKGERKRKKRKTQMGGGGDSHSINNADDKRKNIANNNARNEKVHGKGGSCTDVGCLKRRKKVKKNKDGIQDCSWKILEMPADIEKVAPDDNNDNHMEDPGLVGKKKRHREKGALHMEMEKLDKKTRKKAISINDSEENSVNKGKARTKNNGESVHCDPKLKNPSKRVKFSGKTEVFLISDVRVDEKESHKRGLVRGKRFSQEEDTILRNAVFNYIKEHHLGNEGLNKVLHCKSYPETRNCWREISASMHWRPRKSIYWRAHVLFERGEKREWTADELELLKEFHEKHGADWRTFGDENNKSRKHVKLTWRRICLPNKKRGVWSQDEYQKFFDLVNMNLRMKAFEEKESKHGMLRDNISWHAISQKLSTRTSMDCCSKWYKQLESPLVREEKWASSDDFRLLNELHKRDFSSEEEVEWDDLLDHRPGDICQRRWQQMVNHLGEHRNKVFADKVDVLTKRYCLDVLEPRVAYENKTPVDVQ